MSGGAGVRDQPLPAENGAAVEIEFDPAKSHRNRVERGLPFELVVEADWSAALTVVDNRQDYGETRFVAYVPIERRLHVVCYTMRGAAFRIISFRKANSREMEQYAQATDR
ncbi:hypothetical protein DFR50_13235 [Roseiarcus fermentans]|uniref:Uncharacterized protein n=1 Tax=Roseiarcus fermentans TaxID=1473586 RepID=A0A366EV43_9HYPH|nr:BrnT family toxin [Roseiarcus fermentans]RBP06257.1 hypothetical protein DFR50_13235 [Roseiarcus fermentans]